MKIILLIILVFLIQASCKPGKSLNQNSNSLSSKSSDDSLANIERSKLKKYAFCKCLLARYPNDSLLLKDGSIEGFLQTGSYGNHTYELIDSFVNAELKINYKSKYKKSLSIMQCLDIYENKKLDILIKSLDNENSLINHK